MKPARHVFFLLCLAKRHNACIDNNQADYLRPIYSNASSRKSKPYQCSGKAKQSMKVMKSIKVKKGMKVHTIKGKKGMKGVIMKTMKGK